MKVLRLRQIYTVAVAGGQFVSELLLVFFNRLGEIRRCERRTSSPRGRGVGGVFYLLSDLSYKINKFLSLRDMLQTESKFN